MGRLAGKSSGLHFRLRGGVRRLAIGVQFRDGGPGTAAEQGSSDQQKKQEAHERIHGEDPH